MNGVKSEHMECDTQLLCGPALLCSPHADLMARVCLCVCACVCVGLSDSRTTDNEPDRGVFHRHWIRVRRHCSMLSADLSLSHITCHLVMSSDVLFFITRCILTHDTD